MNFYVPSVAALVGILSLSTPTTVEYIILLWIIVNTDWYKTNLAVILSRVDTSDRLFFRYRASQQP
jgi:hypothetical protein